MAVCLFQASIPAASGLPEDAIVNTFHFEGDPDLDPDNPVDIIQDFYKLAATGAPGSVVALMDASAIGTSLTIKGYNLEESKPRVPFITETTSIAPTGSAPLPSEVALVLSFQAQAESGAAQSRRRNRVYIGQLKAALNTNGRPSSTAINTLTRAARDMLVAANSSINWNWVVYSPTTAAGSSVAAAYWQIDNGWVDNAWDTQRRRGLAPTTRAPWRATFPV